MANVKLSQIASGGAYVAGTDVVVTVRSGTTDVLTQLGSAASAAVDGITLVNNANVISINLANANTWTAPLDVLTTSTGAYSFQVTAPTINTNFHATAGSANYAISTYQNTGGTLYVGVDQSGGGVMPSGLSYAGVLMTVGNTALQFGANNALAMTILPNGNVGIGTSTLGTNTKLTVNPNNTTDNAATVQFNSTATGNKGLVVQGFSGQTANLIEANNSSNTNQFTVSPAGVIQSASLTASQAVFADGSKNLVSNAITGSNKVVMSTTPIIDSSMTVGVASSATGVINFKGATSGTVSLSVADAAGTWTMKLPTTAGTNGYSLTTDGSGNTTWTNVSAGGSGITIGTTTITSGSNTNILYNNSGVVGEYTVSGSGTVVALTTSPTFVTPALGTPASGVVTNLTGTAAINITGTAPAGTLTGTTLNSTVVTSSLTTVGTIGTGVWQGTKIGAAYGGTNADSSSSTGVAQVNSGTWSFSTALANGTTATTQSALDNSTKVATTAYTNAAVTAALNGLDWKPAVGYATTANVVGTNTAGVFTYTSTGADSIDGHTLALNDVVLFKNQTTGADNGVWVVTTAGSIGVAGVLTRRSDYNTAADIHDGDTFFVQNGTVNAATSWVQTDTVTTINTDPLAFSQVAGPGTYVAGTGLTLTGNSFSVNAPQTQITAVGTIATGVWQGTAIGASYVSTLNQNTTGSAASLSISGQTGLLTVTGLTSTNRIKTVRDAADTLLELGGSYTPTGTWTSLTLVTPALGTPASGVLTNCTGLPVAGGGTGLATLTAHAVMLGEGTSNIAFATIGTSGRLLIDQVPVLTHRLMRCRAMQQLQMLVRSL